MRGEHLSTGSGHPPRPTPPVSRAEPARLPPDGRCWGHSLPPSLADSGRGPHYHPPRFRPQQAPGPPRGHPSASEPRRVLRGGGEGRGRFPAAEGGRYLAEREERVGRQPDGGGDGAERAELQARAAHRQLAAGGAVLAAPQRDGRPRRGAEPPLLHPATGATERGAARRGPPACRVPPSRLLPAPRRGWAAPRLRRFRGPPTAGGESAAVRGEPALR